MGCAVAGVGCAVAAVGCAWPDGCAVAAVGSAVAAVGCAVAPMGCGAMRAAPRCGSIDAVLVTPTTRAALVEEIVELVAGRPRRVRLVLDGPAPARPGELAAEIATVLRARGRATLVVDAADFLRPASVRLEQGHTDPDALLERWLDDAALRREVLDPAAPDGSGRVLPRLWNTRTDRAYRDGYTTLPDDGVLVLHGELLLGRGFAAELAVHFRMSAAALSRNLARRRQVDRARPLAVRPRVRSGGRSGSTGARRPPGSTGSATLARIAAMRRWWSCGRGGS